VGEDDDGEVAAGEKEDKGGARGDKDLGRRRFCPLAEAKGSEEGGVERFPPREAAFDDTGGEVVWDTIGASRSFRSDGGTPSLWVWEGGGGTTCSAAAARAFG